MTQTSDVARLTEIVSRVGKIPAVAPDQDLFEAGMSSVDSLPLLLELEDAFGVTIPDEEFIQARTIRGLHEMIHRLQGAAS